MKADNTPFSIHHTRRLECQFGPHYYKEKTPKGARVHLQGSRKIGCNSHIVVKRCTLYQQYKTTDDELQQSSIRTLKEKKMNLLKDKLDDSSAAVETKTMWFVSLPTKETHSGHPVGKGEAGFSQRMNEKVPAKIAEIVADGITDTPQVRSLLHRYVANELSKIVQPDANDRAFFPLDTDIKNHIYMAKRSLQLSCLDQENAHLKIKQWQNLDTDSTHFFRPYVKKADHQEKQGPTEPVEEGIEKHYVGNDGIDVTVAITDDGTYDQPLMWVHQTGWQKELLSRYGNTISLIDATYKTTRYELALFFICVKTNVGYSVVAEFVGQSETSNNINEALTKLKEWNP